MEILTTNGLNQVCLKYHPLQEVRKKLWHGHIESTVSKKQIYILLNFDQGNGNICEK